MQTSSDGFYLGFECHSCGTRIEIVIDDGSDDCHFVGEDVLQIRCSRCQHQSHYKTRDVQRFPTESRG
jgi:hypothetical protein